MRDKSESIGSFQAKTHLSRLLDNVMKGKDYIITKRGKPVARLTPYRANEQNLSARAVVDQFDLIRNSIKGKVNIKEYIKEGRKY